MAENEITGKAKRGRKSSVTKKIFFLFSECRCRLEETLKLASVVPLCHCDTSSKMRLYWSWAQHPLHPEELAVHCPHSSFLNSGWLFLPSGFTEFVQPSPPASCGSQIIYEPLLLWLDSPKPPSIIIVHKNLMTAWTHDFGFCLLPALFASRTGLLKYFFEEVEQARV